MEDLYKLAVDDHRFKPSLFEPLTYCIQRTNEIRKAHVPKKRGPKSSTWSKKIAQFVDANPDCQDWSRRKIASAVGCDESTVQTSEAWKRIMRVRYGEKDRRKNQTESTIAKAKYRKEVQDRDDADDES